MPGIITRRYQQALARVRSQTRDVVGEAWDVLGYYDDAAIPEFLDKVVPIVGGAQTIAVHLTDAYMAHITRGTPIGLDIAVLTGAAVRNGTPPDTVYERPFVNVWTALAGGKSIDDAIASGRDRAVSAAAMDIILSTRAAARAVGQADDRIVGFQRVPDDTACDFCQLIAEQRYTTEDLMPAHNNCGCTVEPLTDPSSTPPAESDFSATGDGISVDVRDHGELGPLIVNADDHFTTQDEIASQ